MADDLKDLRSQLGMTQQQLADALGVGLRTLKGYESADAAPPMALLACRHLLSQQQRMPQDGDGPIVTYESGTYQPAVPVGLEERLAALEADMTILGNLSIEERLNALEAKAKPHRPRFAPDVQALQDKEDARVSDEAVEAEIARYAADGIKVTKEDIAGIRLQLAKRAELEDAEGDDEAPPAVPINRPWNTYRPPELTPAEEAAKKAQRAATKAAHIANGEPWD